MWIGIIGTVLAVFAVGVVYLGFCFGRFAGIKKLSRGKKGVSFLLSLLIEGAVFAAAALTMTMINAIIVMMVLIMFFLLFGIIMRVIHAIRKRDFHVNWQGWLAVLCSIAYLIVGYIQCSSVRQTNYNLTNQKGLNLRVALIADSHLGTTFDGDGFAEKLKTIEAQNPDILMISGDFVDDSSKAEDVRTACEALGKMQVKYGVWYVYGNHDAGYYNSRDFSSDDLEQIMADSGIHVMKDSYELVDDSFYIVGRLDSSFKSRMTADAVMAGVDAEKYIIMLDHQPNDYEHEAETTADLVLSGHTHGGQLIPVTYVGEWFGINDRTYGYEKRNDTEFIVTSGISDWELLFKTGTFSEYVIIDIASN